jgi:hypothetical protein
VNAVRRWRRRLLDRRRLDQELRDEIAFHLSEDTEAQRDRGATERDGLLKARRQFGSTALVAEMTREAWTWPRAESALQDVRYALRTFRRHRPFTATFLVTLALTLGPLAATFSIVQAVLFGPVPYARPEQLMIVGADGNRLDRPAIERLQKTSMTVAFFDPVSTTRTDTGHAERVSLVRTSPNLLSVLGITPSIGRMFSDSDADERRSVSVISDRYWRDRFGASLNVIGRQIVLDGRASEIVGVLPASLPTSALAGDVWEPHTLSPSWDHAPASRAGDSRLDANRREGPTAVPIDRFLVSDRSRTAVWLLLAAALSVVLIAVANLVALAFARTLDRSVELTTRSTVGAGATRLWRQLITEHTTLSLLGGVAAVPIALVIIAGMRTFGATEMPNLAFARLDFAVLVWTGLCCVAVGGAIGGFSSAGYWRSNLNARGASTGAASRRAGRRLAIAEFTLALAVMTTTGLLLRSWWNVAHIDLGFSPAGVMSIQLAAPERMPVEERARLYASVLDSVAALPHVEKTAIVGDLLVGPPAPRVVTGEGASSQSMPVRVDEVSGQFFSTLQIPLRTGRLFSEQDEHSGSHTIIVNERLAQRIWPGADPIGRRLKFGPADANTTWATIVGVVGDVRREGPETEPVPQIFQPLTPNASRLETLLIKTSAVHPLGSVPSVASAVGRVNRELVAYAPAMLEERIATFTVERRFQGVVLMLFSALSLTLAAIGAFGVTYYSVTTRTFEFGIRRALGATERSIVRGVIGESVRAIGAATVLGGLLAMASARLVASQLFGISPIDVPTFATVALLLGATGLVAAYLPARRAANIDPAVLLRR